MKKKLFTLMTLLLCAVTGAWAADWTIALTNFTRTSNTYEYTFSETKLNAYKDGLIYVEVPSANVSGTVSWQGSGAKSDRVLYIYKTNGTVKDETRGMVFAKDWVSVDYTSSDILTKDGKYYLVFNTQHDWKATGVKYTVPAATKTFTVTFKAGTNGNCGTASLTETSVGAGITLPEVTANSGYIFNGWFTAANDGIKAGDAGETYYPSEDVTLFAQYLAESAPTISIDETNVTTDTGVEVTLTATATGAPTPTVTWYQNTLASTTGGTLKGTGLTFKPDVTVEGTYYYYAIASNGIGNNAVSDIVTLTVESPVLVYDAAGKTDEVILLTRENINDNGYLTCNATNWQDKTSWSTYGGYYLDMKTNRKITFTVKNADSFEFFLSGTAGRTFTIKVGAAPAVVYALPGTGSGFTPAGIIPTGTTDEVDITIEGGSQTLYPVYIKVNPTSELIKPNQNNCTYVTTQALDFSSVEGLAAYVAKSASADDVIMTPVDAVPAGTPLLLIGTKGTEYTVPFAASASTPTINLLKAGDGSTSFDGTTYDYILFSDGKFYQIGDGTVAANKAYLHLETAPAGSRELNVIFDDSDATGINIVEAIQPNDGVYYNIAGQRVAQPKKGLYIVNGKKYIVK